MSKHYGYPDFSPEGVQIVTTMDGYYKDALMNVTVYKMKAGENRSFLLPLEEMAILLMNGDMEWSYQSNTQHVQRDSCFDEGSKAYGLHVCKNVEVTVKALADSEILVQSTTNDGTFDTVFYTPDNIRNEIVGEGLCGDTAVRRVTTFFDYSTAPYSNMVLGETYLQQGSWSGYPPHGHTQPEIYYYRTDKPQGFGACFFGDEVYKIKDYSFSCLTGGLDHPQAAAPGYRIYVVWIIRHLPGDPWVDRVELPEHVWVKDAKF